MTFSKPIFIRWPLQQRSATTKGQRRRLRASPPWLRARLTTSPPPLRNGGSVQHSCTKMAKGLIWATAEDLARNRARLAKKAEVRAIFTVASEERSLHNIQDLFDAADYSLSLLRKGVYFVIFPSRPPLYS
ncbi:hypothetical protein Vadar_006242 [Vaccinium darrowii]|uniref:Uncharacterized protein n=1 Tax=Vaccinium darrowii TaxID=229202 RepID=A0ACB7ZAA5_9ERIC|nr:hypothetical protein Vadar_006242 [Vaccinium darrowii]